MSKALNVKPTRMELLNLKKKISLAKKGHKLLKEKRDALFNEFFTTLNRAKELRKSVESNLSEAYNSLAVTEAQLGISKVKEFAVTSSDNASLSLAITQRNIMGVKVPSIEASNLQRNLLQRGYSLIQSSASLDDTSKLFEKNLNEVIKLAEMESVLENLAIEIEKTKRKVNALEYIIIPRLIKARKYIAFRLEEMEREKFFVLKKVKKKIALKKEQQ
ncbi:MAG TPA: V-type ATP synthase subunit D [archaeon]|nr:V-type ATP synthase subunit D [archaeon]